MKRTLSIRQWAAALIIFAGFCTATLSGYLYNHADSEFEAFAEDFFLQELQADPIQFHYSIDHPETCRIDEAALTLPVYHAGDAANDIYALSIARKQLQTYEDKNLSEANRYLCRLLGTYIEAVSRTAAYPYFAEPLSPSSGAISELPILLAEYRIDDVQDIEMYLKILEQIPDHLNGLITYEQEKSAAGLFMSDRTADKVIRQCSALMDTEQLENDTHFLETTFASRLEKLVDKGLITRQEALAYESDNNRLLTTVVAPAYDKAADGLTLLKGTGKDTCGLAHYAGGKEYYEALLRLRTGSYRSIGEIRQLLYDDLAANYTELGNLLRSDESLRNMFVSENDLLPDMTPEEMLDHLQSAVEEDYPGIPSGKNSGPVECTIKYVDDSLAPYSAPAFYMTPPVDNALNNTIYINTPDVSDDLSLFTTLAHEGYPGHLYQTVYSQKSCALSGMTPFRSVLYYGGYVEGWAMYAEFASYDYAAELAGSQHPDAAGYYHACRLDRKIQLCLYSLLDIAIHYDGAALEDIQNILASFGTADADTAAAVYSYIAEEPCNYPKYYLGYLEIMELKKQAAEIWRRNNQTPAAGCDAVYDDPDFLNYFHGFLLRNGPADFKTLSDLLSS